MIRAAIAERTVARSVARPTVALVLALTVACGGTSAPPPTSTVASAEVIRGSLTLTRDGGEETLTLSGRVETGATATTSSDGRAALTHDRGAWILMDRGASVTTTLEGLTLGAGRIWVDASSADPTDAYRTEIATAHGRLVVSGAALAIAITDAGTSVYVGSGEATYRGADGSEGQVMQGEALTMPSSGAPTISPEGLWDDWTGGLADPARGRLRTRDPVGTLRARAPYELGVARAPLPVRSHEVHVTITGDLAVTEVTQTFFNARSDTLEGVWQIRLPDGAIVEEFAVNTTGAFVPAVPQPVRLDDGYVLSWMGPDFYDSRLSYDGPGRLRARIYPITNGSTVQVRIRFVEWLARQGGRRTYTYPMRGDGDPPLLSEFILDVDVSAANASAYRAGMGATDEGGRITLRLPDYRPRADFTLDLYDPPGVTHAPVTAYAVSGNAAALAVAAEGDERYVLFDVGMPEVLGAIGAEPAAAPLPLSLVLLVDASGATEPEDLEIARAVVESVMRQLAPTDRVTLRVADVTAHVPEGGIAELVAPDETNREAILASIERIEPGGATDLGESLRAAATLLASEPRGAVLYLGDAMPTTGGLDATTLRTTLATLDAPPRFFALAVGDGANLDLLRGLFGDGASAVRDRENASRTVMSLLAEAARPTLRNVTVSLAEGVERIFPSETLAVGETEHLLVVGRQAGTLPSELTVRGTRDRVPFEVTLPITIGTVADRGDIRRRWATARLFELLDADAGREALVELGTRFSIVTPWTVLQVGGGLTNPVPLVRSFDHDPVITPWGLGGGGATIPSSGLITDAEGWRRRRARGASASPVEEGGPEATWASRVDAADAAAGTSAAAPTGDGGLGRAAIERTLVEGERGPRGCYDRRAEVRPDLSGSVTVTVTVGGDGTPRTEPVVSSSLGDDETERCIRTEVSGLSFPATGATSPVVVTHVYVFDAPERELGSRRSCSEASAQSLEARRALWEERLAQSPGSDGALAVYRAAGRACELDGWRAKRTLIDLILGQLGGLYDRVALYRALRSDASVAGYLRRAILRSVRTPSDVAYVRWQMGLEPGVEWWVFSRLWSRNPDPAARLALVRRWLEVAPEDIDLRLRLLSLLEQTGALEEARRVARELRADPLADARARTEIGEFWLRQEQEAEARRVFSEIVEHTPLDPWARRRLGDLYRAHHWSDDAYREYATLARLRPGDDEVLLLLARAAADADRIDEALRLEQRVSESAEPGSDVGNDASAAASARLWSQVRLARLSLDADEATRAAIRRRLRETGALRDPPDALVVLTFEHPDDAPMLSVRWPSADGAGSGETAGNRPFTPAGLGDVRSGIRGIRISELEAGEHLFEVSRADLESLRDWSAELWILEHPGTAEERVVRQPITLTRTARTVRFAWSGDGTIRSVPVP